VEETLPTEPIKLIAKTAREARREIAARFPQGATYTGYDIEGQDVLMSLVRAKGDKASVATVRRNGSLPPVSFTCIPLS
jgi:hypothetical protein